MSDGDGGSAAVETDGPAASMRTTEAGDRGAGGGSDAASDGTDAGVSGNTASSGSDGGGGASNTTDSAVVGADDAPAAVMSDGAIASLDASGICSDGGKGCPPGQCDPTLGCMSCSTDSQCPATARFCVMGTCVQCKTNNHCGNGTATSVCVQNACVQCGTNADCSGGTPYCSSNGNSASHCVQCLDNTHCPPSAPSCNGGTCGQPGG